MNGRRPLQAFRFSATLRCLKALLVLLVALGVTFPAPAWARKKKPKKQAPPMDLAEHIEYLGRQLYGLHLDESDALTSEIQKLVLDHMQGWLEQHPPSDQPTFVPYHVDVRRELESAFSKLQYPVYAWPSTFAERWGNRFLIGVGYTLGWSKYERANLVALYERDEGKLRPAGVTNFVPRTDLHYEFMDSPASGEFRFLVYGTRLGKSHPRLSAEFYSFDGRTLKSLWKTEDIYDGKLDVERDRVVIRYMKESEFIEAATYDRNPPHYEVVYKVTPAGLEVIADRQVPSQGQ